MFLSKNVGLFTICVRDKSKNNQYHSVMILYKQRLNHYTPNTHMHYCSVCWVDTITSIKSGGFN